MAVVSEPIRVATWGVGLLAADPTLVGFLGGAGRIHREVAPLGPNGEPAPTPYVLIRQVSEPDGLLALGGESRIWAEFHWQFLAVTQGKSALPLLSIADRLEALLNANAGTTAGLRIVGSTWRRPFYQTYHDEHGRQWQELGAEWDIKGQAL